MIDNWNFLAAGLASAPGLVLSGSLLTLGLLALRHRARRRREARADKDLSASMTLEAVRDLALFRISLKGVVESWTPAAEALFSKPAHSVIGKPLSDLIGAAPADDLVKTADACGHHSLRPLIASAEQGARHLHLTLDLLRDPIGRKAGFAVTARDVTEDETRANRLEALYAKGHLALEALTLGIAVFDPQERLVFSNPAFRQITRLPQALAQTEPDFREILFFALGRLLQPRDALEADVAELYRRYRENLIRPGGGALIETFGGDRAIQIRTTVLEDGGMVIALDDLSQHLQSERSLAYAARHDAVTGLPNRQEFEDYLDDALAHARRKALRLSALTVDLSRFQVETKRFGADEADALLRRFAARLAGCLIQGEFMARTEADRLTVLKPHAQPAELEGLVKRLRMVLSERFEHQGEGLAIPVRLDLRPIDTRLEAGEVNLDQAVEALNQVARTLGSAASAAAPSAAQDAPAERAVS